MLDPQYWLSLGALGTILLVREHQHQKLVRALIDKILIKNDLAPLPETNLLQETLDAIKPKEVRTPYNQPDKKKMERAKKMMHFNVPGMDVAKAMGLYKEPE